MTPRFVIIVLLVAAAVGGWRMAAQGKIDGAQIVRLIAFGVAMLLVPGAFGCEADDLFLPTNHPVCGQFLMVGCASLVMALVSAVRWSIDPRKQ